MLIEQTQKYIATLLLLLLIGVSNGFAQFEGEDDYVNTPPPRTQQGSKESFSDKVFVGGGLGLQFGDITRVELSPIVGYKITERFHSGVGFTYTYFEDSRVNYSTNIVGGSVFSRFLITDNIFAHAEYEALNGQWEFDREAYFINSIFIGGGFMQRFGNSFAAIMLLYNINDSAFNPYTNPVIRMNFGIGF